MSLKKIVGLTVLGLALLVIVGGIALLILVRMRPGWYEYQELSPKEMLAAKEDMIRRVADFHNAATEAEAFVLVLNDKQINDMVAVIVDRHRVLPDYLAHPQIRMRKDKILAGVMVSFKGQTSFFSIGIRPYVDSAGLLHVELGKPKAGALRLPKTFVPETIDKVERSLSASLAASRSESERVQTARKNKDLLTRIFTALHGVPVPASFVTRDDLQMAIEDVRITLGLLEIKFRPILTETSAE